MDFETIIGFFGVIGFVYIGSLWGEIRGFRQGKLAGEQEGYQRGRQDVTLEEALQVVAAYQDRLLRARQYAAEGLLLRSYNATMTDIQK
jgi:hypothetical protein